MQNNHQRVVIVGGGFAGLAAAMALRRTPVQITLIDRRNFHLFQPLLYQVATGGLSPANIASPLRGILSRQRNIRVLKGEVTDIDPQAQTVRLGDDDDKIPYDYLLVATGCRHHYFGNQDWEAAAPGLKTIEDAVEIRRRVLGAFEQAERETNARRRAALLTFVVVGGGPTGVELAGALGELAHHTLRHDFRHIDTTQAKILLVEGAERLLPTYTVTSSQHAAKSLAQLGVTVLTSTQVSHIEEGRVTLRNASDTREVETETVLWGAGVQASALGVPLSQATGAATDRQGRIVVEPDLSIPGYPNIFVLGDLARVEQDGQLVPGVAPAAMQQGVYGAKSIAHRLQGRKPKPFRYKDLGSMAVIGRAAAVAELGRFRLHGYLAWLMWLFVHLINLVEFKSRVLVLFQWGWSYFTRNRSARLITNDVMDETVDSFSHEPTQST